MNVEKRAQARGLTNARWGSGEVSGVIHTIEVPKHAATKVVEQGPQTRSF